MAAVRYCGNIIVRLTLRRMRGWNGRMGVFYVGRISIPGSSYSGQGVISRREARAARGASLSEGYDRAASVFLDMAADDAKEARLIHQEASWKDGEWEILRTPDSPCPVGDS